MTRAGFKSLMPIFERPKTTRDLWSVFNYHAYFPKKSCLYHRLLNIIWKSHKSSIASVKVIWLILYVISKVYQWTSSRYMHGLVNNIILFSDFLLLADPWPSHLLFDELIALSPFTCELLQLPAFFCSNHTFDAAFSRLSPPLCSLSNSEGFYYEPSLPQLITNFER